jgi:hypothetical protein
VFDAGVIGARVDAPAHRVQRAIDLTERRDSPAVGLMIDCFQCRPGNFGLRRPNRPFSSQTIGARL